MLSFQENDLKGGLPEKPGSYHIVFWRKNQQEAP
jgi:hypothetical protein